MTDRDPIDDIRDRYRAANDDPPDLYERFVGWLGARFTIERLRRSLFDEAYSTWDLFAVGTAIAAGLGALRDVRPWWAPLPILAVWILGRLWNEGVRP